MAFSGGGGFSGGFGSNNNTTNNQQSGGFGFGSNNNTSGGFGQSTTGGFGSSTTSSNPFGGGSGGFGSNNNTSTSLFGQKTNPFGGGSTTTSTSLFGGGGTGGTSNPTGGFGSSTGTFGANTNSASGPFGGSGTTSGGFGSGFSSGTAFGSSTQTKPLFGQGGSGTTGAFGGSGGFGSGTALNNQPVPPSDGTASTAFQPFSDKESNGQTSTYQSINFQQPYTKYSFEELRLADYNAGRRYGNGSGQAGAFGSSAFGGGSAFGSGAGGFGSGTTTASNPFGGTSTGFGSAGSTSTSFGSGLFGSNNQNQNKPGGLFGQQTSSGATGGLFGTASGTNTTTNNTFGGFGNNNPSSSGTGLFGNNNNNQNKPGGLFGSANTSNTFNFGNNNNQQQQQSTGGSLFGGNTATANTGGGLFGNNNNQQANSSGGLFGNNQNQSSGGLFGNKTGGFGSNTTTSGGLFGNNTASSTGGGLFGNAANTNTSGGGLFGNNNANNASSGGGLFGNNQAKPGGLFGNTNNATTSGGLFGNNAQNTNTGGGLFGNNNQQQASGGLFGNNANTGGGLFGNAQAQNKPGGLFGQSSTNTGGGLFGNNNSNTLFGNSQNNQPQNQQQQPEFKHSSLLDPNPYGQSSIWTGLPAPTPDNAKPVFTPLTATQKMKESTMKPPPSLRLNQSRYMTPPRRNGYGFSYSTYGTPNSAASTPGGASLSGSMYGGRGWSGGSFGRAFNKSASVQNLRSQFASDADDIWKPGAFSPAHRNSSGSIKRLTIDRSIRQDLFNRPTPPTLPAPPKTISATANGSSSNRDSAPPEQPKVTRRVTFDEDVSDNNLNGESGALVRTEIDSDDEGTPRPTTNGNSNNNVENGRGSELGTVPEEHEPTVTAAPSQSRRALSSKELADPKPGQYWMKPTREEIKKLTTEQARNFKNFEVGRTGCARVIFHGPVDLTKLDLDHLFDDIVQIGVRNVTVYKDRSPPRGQGLNVPSTIEIFNSWPRASSKDPVALTSGPQLEKHINRLKKTTGTEFVDYDPYTGTWKFKVEHYTTYGLDYDEDEMDESELSPPPDTVEKPADTSVMEVDKDEDENFEDDIDENDTFAFKKSVPGGFDGDSLIDYQPRSQLVRFDDHRDDRSEQSAYSEDEVMSEDEQSPNMPGSLPNLQPPSFQSPNKPILKASRMDTPGNPLLDLEGDWAEQLQRTISPRKQNRDILREAQSKVLLDRAYQPIKPKSAAQQDFRNSIDIMNSLFAPAGHTRVSKKTAKASEPDFEFPYAKRPKTFNPDDERMSEADQKWHDSFKPSFTTEGALVFKARRAKKNPTWKNDNVATDNLGTVYLSHLVAEKSFDLASEFHSIDVQVKEKVPLVLHRPMPFAYLSHQDKEAEENEAHVYALAHVLFDDYEDEFTLDLPPNLKGQFMHRIRKDRLSQFLSNYVLKKHGRRITALERDEPTAAALLHLTAHDIKGACDLLAKEKNNRLMLLISQLGGQDQDFMEDIAAQLVAWRDQNALSEMTEDIRALYEICAGNVTISEGNTHPKTPVENRASTFSIGEKFDLDWIQCFALGLWFGKEEKSNRESFGKVEDAVREFQRRCDEGSESVKPADDPMWVLLKLYATQQGESKVNSPSFPQDLVGLAKPWNSGAVFKLYHAITANIPKAKIDRSAGNELAASLAAELSSKNDIAGAVYALLHLSDSKKRQALVQDLLVRFAAHLPGPDSATTNEGIQLWQLLTINLRIPQSWLFTAKALYARAALANHVAELRYLVAAESWTEAHECLIKRVAPGCVVDADWGSLEHAVGIFGANPESKVPGWNMGGGVYQDFTMSVVKSASSRDANTVESLRKRLVELGRVQRQSTLPPSVKQLDLAKLSLHELEAHVAVKEMARYVALWCTVEGSEISRKDVLELPLNADQRRSQVIAMAGEYYDTVMRGSSSTAS